MEKSDSIIKLFENSKIRAVWDENAGKWWFSVVDVVGVLTDQLTQDGARNYWKVLKKRLIEEGNEPVTNCNRLKLPAQDGKMRLTDVASIEQLFRIIQSIPSPKAEPFKQWLAKVGSERIDETIDPELSIDRAIQNYRRLGYNENRINQRIKSIEVRKSLTDEWENFSKVIDKAKESCTNAGENIAYHFPDIRKMVKIAYHFPDIRKVIEAGKAVYRFPDVGKTIKAKEFSINKIFNNGFR